jgi:hypothetical protein
MTCDEFASLMRRNPEECSMSEVAFSEQHYRQCPHCHVLVDFDEHSMIWRFAWAKFDHDAKRGAKKMVGCAVAIAICLLLGVLLRWWMGQ